MFFLQYMKGIHERVTFLFERYSLLLLIGIVWAFAAILTASGAYNNVPDKTKRHCRVDRSYLMSSAPWYDSNENLLGPIFTDINVELVFHFANIIANV